MWSAGQGDDKERFLADLRALRDTASLGYEELAARAHYPSDILKEAENGPSLPGLPILAAYVRACEGDVPEWEERWRRLGFEVRADPGLPVRPPGASPAAVAGARAGVSIAAPEAYDPERIRASLRGSHLRGADASSGADASRDVAADLGSAAANGNHQAWHHGDAPLGAAVTGTADPAAAADALRRDPFSTSWLQDGQPIPPRPAAERGRQDRAGSDRASPESAGQPPNWTDFWTPVKAAATPADVQRPGDSPPAAEPAAAGTSWSAFTPSSPSVTADQAHRPAPDLPQRAEPASAQGAAARLAGPDPEPAQPMVPAASVGVSSAAPARSQTSEPVVPQPAPAPSSESRPDRYYPLRLLTVIVVAALIGSVLVLLLR